MDQLKWFLTIAFSFSGTSFAETNTLSEDWFQIDTIIFEYLEPDTSENMGNGEKKYYPQNVIAIDENLKAVKEDDGLKARNEPLSMENGSPNASQNISFELESESARRFNRELLEALIKRSSENQSDDSPEKTPDIAENGFRAKIIKELLSQLNPSSEGQLAFKDFSSFSDLREIKEKIKRSARMRVLAHKSWIQPIGSDQTSIMIQGGAKQGEKYEIEGFMTLYRKRFLHVMTDLWFTKSATNYIEERDFSNAPLRESANGNLFTEASNSSSFNTFMMKQQRRVRAAELHYLDHPFFGLILKITRFSRDTKEN